MKKNAHHRFFILSRFLGWLKNQIITCMHKKFLATTEVGKYKLLFFPFKEINPHSLFLQQIGQCRSEQLVHKERPHSPLHLHLHLLHHLFPSVLNLHFVKTVGRYNWLEIRSNNCAKQEFTGVGQSIAIFTATSFC